MTPGFLPLIPREFLARLRHIPAPAPAPGGTWSQRGRASPAPGPAAQPPGLPAPRSRAGESPGVRGRGDLAREGPAGVAMAITIFGAEAL